MRHSLANQLRRTFDASSLDAPTVNVIPNAESDANPTLVRGFDEALERGGIASLLLSRNACELDFGILVDIEEEWIQRRHESAALISEYDHKVVDAAGCQQVEICFPVHRVVQSLFEPASLHGVRRNGAVD